MLIFGFSYIIHIALAASIAEPPPSAMITSGWKRLIASRPFSTMLTSGSGSISSKTSIASLLRFWCSWYSTRST